MWPTFSHASGGIFRLSLINILTLELSNNNENQKPEIIWHKHCHIDAIKKRGRSHVRGKDERAPQVLCDLGVPIGSLHTLPAVPVEEIYCTSNVCRKGKDGLGWLGQGQVCQGFYFGRTDDLFKTCNPRDSNNAHDVLPSGRADSQLVYASVFYTSDRAQCCKACAVQLLV